MVGDGIDLTGLGIDPAGTARSVNLVGVDGSRINFYDGRGHRDLTVDPELVAELFAGARLAFDPDDEYLRDFLEDADVLFVSSAHHLNPAPMLKRLVRRSGEAMVEQTNAALQSV